MIPLSFKFQPNLWNALGVPETHKVYPKSQITLSKTGKTIGQRFYDLKQKGLKYDPLAISYKKRLPDDLSDTSSGGSSRLSLAKKWVRSSASGDISTLSIC